MQLAELLPLLESIAPPGLAEAWDHVGLQLGRADADVHRALICIDLTEAVLDEAIADRATLVVAYHPPIFKPLVALTDAEPRQRLLLRAAEHRIALYSPHTALDAAPGGVNDWLAEAVTGTTDARITPIRPATPDAAAETGEVEQVVGVGVGRIVELAEPVALSELVDRVKAHLGVDHLDLAAPPGVERVRRVGLCPGAGGSLLADATTPASPATPASLDAFLTGEMRHHDVLDAVARGVTILLAGHAQTERPYLPRYRDRLAPLTGGNVAWRVSDADRPIAITR
ncbi:MAG: Nif3-like dinuclear metal center hexameric protein [Phycisphaeraceae bacterium]